MSGSAVVRAGIAPEALEHHVGAGGSRAHDLGVRGGSGAFARRDHHRFVTEARDLARGEAHGERRFGTVARAGGPRSASPGGSP